MCYFKLSAVPFINLYKEIVMTQSSDNIPDGHAFIFTPVIQIILIKKKCSLKQSMVFVVIMTHEEE